MKSRSPLKRKTPLRRSAKKTGAGTTRKRSSRSRGPARDEKYLAAVRALGCEFARRVPLYIGRHFCDGPIDAHHAGRRPGVGMKCSDYEAHGFCRKHHSDWHRGAGYFSGWDRELRRSWADCAIAFTQAALNHLIKAQP